MALELDLEKINDSNHLLDILIQVESVLDSMDAYAFYGWFDGEIVEGPIVRRHWVTISLLYPYESMPDPQFALRLLKHGIQVEFDRMQHAAEPAAPGETKPHKQLDDWLVKLTFPRRLLDQNEEADLEAYADELNADDVTDAQDTGLDDESALHTDEQTPQGGPDDAMGMEPPGQAPAPAPPSR